MARTTTEIEADLADARAARGALVRGERVTEVMKDGRRMTFAGMTIGTLDATILSLENELAGAIAAETGVRRRRGIALRWAN